MSEASRVQRPGINSRRGELKWPWSEVSALDSPPWSEWGELLAKKQGQGTENQQLCRDVIRSFQSIDEVPVGATLEGLRRVLSNHCDSHVVDAWILDVLEQAGEGCETPASRAMWSVSTLLVGGETKPPIQLAHAVAPLVGLVSALARVWLDRGVGENREAVHDGVLLEASGAPADLLGAWAGAQGDKQRERTRLVLSQPEIVEKLGCWWAQRVREAGCSLPDEHCGELIEELDAMFHWLESYASFRALVEVVQSRGSLMEQVEEALSLCRAFLCEQDDWSDSWEVRRRGLASSSEHLIGSWFHRGFILRCLWRMGDERPARLTALLGEEGFESLRWFGPSRIIPPDADSLGLALDLSARRGVEVAKERVEAWLETMELSADVDGRIPTWFLRDRQGPTLDEGELSYRGDDCVAVRLALSHGLLARDPERFAELIEVNLEGLLEGGMGSLFFYPSSYAEELFFRVEARLKQVMPSSRLLDPLAELGQKILDGVRSRQRRDGSFGGSQETAWCLSSLLLGGGDPTETGRAARFLVETLRPDGSWAAEPFYIMPGRGEVPEWHLGRSMTTAVCGVALSMYARQ